MRSRFLKPGFFTNERLAELDYAARLLFAGLWLIADRRGRLEDRPKRIQAALFAYDKDLDVDRLLASLCAGGFIVRYTVGAEGYIAIVKFHQHQHPHVREPDSVIPAPPPLSRGNGKRPGPARVEPVQGDASVSAQHAPRHRTNGASPVLGRLSTESESEYGVRDQQASTHGGGTVDAVIAKMKTTHGRKRKYRGRL